MARSKYDAQLETILVTVARHYRLPLVPPGWKQAGDLQIPLPVMAERMLHYAVMVVIGDRHGHDSDSLRQALTEFARLHSRLYDYLVVKLYSTQSSKRLEVNYYEADDFLVLVLTAGVAPVLEAMSQIIIPFVIQHHRQRTPDFRALRLLADKLIAALYADPEPLLRDGIIERVEPLLVMNLRLLPLNAPAEPPAAPPPPTSKSMSPDQLLDEEFAPDTGDFSAEPEPPPAQQSAGKGRTILRAPLPYWDIKDRKE